VTIKVTDLGLTLSAAFCGVWVWAAENLQRVEAARSQFDKSARQRRAFSQNSSSSPPGQKTS
jgi:hypothetical protein